MKRSRGVFRLFCYLLFLSFFLPSAAKAQTGSVSTLSFDQFFQNYSMLNPASYDSSGKYNLRIGHVSLSGLFEGVNRLYIDGDIRPGKLSDNSFSRIGFFVLSLNDGDFINRTRILGRYSRTIFLGNEQFISVGLALGVISYSFQGTKSFAGGRSSVFDANAGVWYIRKRLKVGVSLQQIPESVIRPVQQAFELQPYLNVNAVYTLNLSNKVLLTNHIYITKEASRPYSFEYAPILLFDEILEAGFNFKYQRGVAVMLGVNTEVAQYGSIYTMGSFLISTRKLSNSADNKFEISAGYSF